MMDSVKNVEMVLVEKFRTSTKDQIVSIGRAFQRIETLVRHLKGCSQPSLHNALVPMPGTQRYYDWLGILLKNRAGLGEFVQLWLRDSSETIGGSSIRRVRVIAGHLSASPLIIDAW
jgi:hypothetical protein